LKHLLCFLLVIFLNIPAFSTNSPHAELPLAPFTILMFTSAPFLGISYFGTWWTSQAGSYSCHGTIRCCTPNNATNCSTNIPYPSLCNPPREDTYCNTSNSIEHLTPVSTKTAFQIGVPLAIGGWLTSIAIITIPIYSMNEGLRNYLALLLQGAASIAVGAVALTQDQVWGCKATDPSNLQCCVAGQCFPMQPKDQCPGKIRCTHADLPRKEASRVSLGLGIPMVIYGAGAILCSLVTIVMNGW